MTKIPNVPRELLERAWRALANSATGREIGAYLDADPCAPECAETCARASMCAARSADLSAPSPAGVDGLETIGYATESELAQLLDPTMPTGKYVRIGLDHPTCWKEDAPYEHLVALCVLSDASAIIDGLRGEVADLRSMLATVSKAGLRVRTERDQHAKRIGELEGLLRDSAELIKHGVFEDGYCCCGSSVDSHGLGDGHSPVDALAYHAGQVCERIDAALSAGKEGE